MAHIKPSTPQAETAGGQPRPASQGLALLLSLRHATADQHAAVERLPLMADLMAPAVNWEDYRAYLERMTRVYGSLEPGLLAVLDQGLPPDASLRPLLRPKLPLLLADLAVLGIEVPALPASPRAMGLSAALGGLYVLEGASLGSRVIARHLQRFLPDGSGDQRRATAFLRCLDDPGGPPVSLAWRRFGDSLEALAAAGVVARDPVIEGARATFERVYEILAAAPTQTLAAPPCSP